MPTTRSWPLFGTFKTPHQRLASGGGSHVPPVLLLGGAESALGDFRDGHGSAPPAGRGRHPAHEKADGEIPGPSYGPCRRRARLGCGTRRASPRVYPRSAALQRLSPAKEKAVRPSALTLPPIEQGFRPPGGTGACRSPAA